MGREGVGVALAEVGIDQLPVLQGKDLRHAGDARVRVGKEKLFGLGGALHGHPFPRQVSQRLYVAVLPHGHHLAAV